MTNDYKKLLKDLDFYPSRSEVISESLTEADIQHIESKLGSSLPRDYRQFLAQYSDILSSDIRCFYYVMNGWQEQGLVHGLYGRKQEGDLADDYLATCRIFQSDENYNLANYPGVRLLRDTNTAHQQIGWPEELLAIGTDPGDNQICVAFKGLSQGAIFLWIVNPWEGEQNLYFVANSFDEFLHSLKKVA